MGENATLTNITTITYRTAVVLNVNKQILKVFFISGHADTCEFKLLFYGINERLLNCCRNFKTRWKLVVHYKRSPNLIAYICENKKLSQMCGDILV